MASQQQLEIPKTHRTWTCVRASSRYRSALQLNQYSPLTSSSSSSTHLAPTSVLIRIAYSSLNPVDLFLVKAIPSWLPWRRDPIPAFDFAGAVVSVGRDVPAEFKRGDQVAGALVMKDIWVGKGTLAEYVEVDWRIVVKVPENLSSAVGLNKLVGVFGIAGQTAAEMVRRAKGADVRGKKVLVYGASGGVGSFVVQICKGLGADKVWGVCSGGNKGLVEGLGGEVIDYTQYSNIQNHLAERFGNGNELDVVFECSENNNELFSKAEKFLKADGQFISIVGGWSQGLIPHLRNNYTPVLLGGVRRSYEIFLLTASGEIGGKVREYVERGIIREMPVDSEFEMEEVVEAFERLATGRARGKVVVRVGGDDAL
ncbi:chaperonin 10-like protein [Cladorrhinum sp. PSN332]|nr:chaperonin 10-like protein [Cladorrhinum sp. PSN332]